MALKSELFDASKLPLPDSFDCGGCDFGKIATAWIKCADPTDSALEDMRSRQTAVFLYFEDDGTLVGFGSIGLTTYKVNRVKQTWSIIPHLGIDARFRKKPDNGPWQDRYASQIVFDLIESCIAEHATETLTLKVHKDNAGAIRLYEKHGFSWYDGKIDARGYRRMTGSLRALSSSARTY